MELLPSEDPDEVEVYDDFELPDEVRALKEEVMSGQTWSMNLDVSSEGSFEMVSSTDDESTAASTPMVSITSSHTVRRPVMRAPPTHRDVMFLAAFVAHWGAVVGLAQLLTDRLNRQTSKGKANAWAFSETGPWKSAFSLACILGSGLGILVGVLHP